MATDSVPASRRKRLPSDLDSKAEDMAIQAHRSLISLGYGEEIEPLRLRNRRGMLAIVFASIAGILYGIGGFIYGMEVNKELQNFGFLFHFFDSLTIAAIITAGIALCLGILGFFKKHSSQIPSIISFVILLTAPLVLHILGVTAGLLVP